MLVELEIFPGGYGPPTRKVFVEADTVLEVVPYRKDDCEVRLRDGSSYSVKSSASEASVLINANKTRARVDTTGPTPVTPDVEDANVERLNRFRDLKKNWDSYGGSPIDQRAIEIALRLVSVLPGWQVVPRSDGNIQFERGNDEICIDVSAINTIPGPPSVREAARLTAGDLVDKWRHTWKGMADACLTANRLDLVDRIATAIERAVVPREDSTQRAIDAVLHCSCGAACTSEEYQQHVARGHDVGLRVKPERVGERCVNLCNCTDENPEVCLAGEADEGSRYCHCTCHKDDHPAKSVQSAGERIAGGFFAAWMNNQDVATLENLRDAIDDAILSATKQRDDIIGELYT